MLQQSMADVRDKGDSSSSFLILKMYYHLFVLDIKDKDKDPVLLKTIDLLEERLPLNMGVMRLDKQFFMFGGEIGVQKYISGTNRFAIKYDENVGSHPFKGAVKNVYKLNRYNNWSLEKTKVVRKPMCPKFDPTVAEVEGKIFVLQGTSFLRSMPPHCMCEVYNPTNNTWKQLPKMPIDEQCCEDIGYFPTYLFVGRRMYLNFSGTPSIICFNCDTEKFEKSHASNLRASLERACLNFPDIPLSVNDNIILECYQKSISAYFIDDSGSVVCYQDLHKLCADIVGEYNMGLRLIDQKSDDGQMCLILLEPKIIDPTTGSFVYTILIRHFKLKVTKSPSAIADAVAVAVAAHGDYAFLNSLEFLEFEITGNQRVTLPDSVAKYEFELLRGAFFF